MPGGRNDGAVRVGQTVRRRTGEQTVGVHALLTHLHAMGFSRAPRVPGIDEQGREVLSFLPGETVGEARPWPPWTHSDATLVAAGQWLRDFHAASASFVPPAGARWFGDHDDLRAGEVIGHHDAAPYNAVWQPTVRSGHANGLDDGFNDQTGTSPGLLVGFIDWDLAGPVTPLRDLAFVALTWVPLTANDVAASDGFPLALDHGVDPVALRGRRLRLLLQAYGWQGSTVEVLTAVRQRAVEHAEGLRAAAHQGYGPATALVEEGVAAAFERAVTELDATRNQLLRAAASTASN